MSVARIAGALGLLVLMTASGHANIVTRTYDLTASGFTPTPAPYDPVEVNFTVTFDNSMTFGATTNGLTINLNTLPYTAVFEYNSTDDILTIATQPSSAPPQNTDEAYDEVPNSFGSFIGNATGATPFTYGLSYEQGDGTNYNATVYAVTASPLTTSTVPLPASAPMFGAALLALAAIGLGMSRKAASV